MLDKGEARAAAEVLLANYRGNPKGERFIEVGNERIPDYQPPKTDRKAVRDAIKAGKTSALILAGSTEQNGPYLAGAKHQIVLRQTGVLG